MSSEKAPLPAAIERRYGDSDATRQMITDTIAMRQAIDRIEILEIALHRIAGHADITGEKAREIAAEALSS